MRPAMRCRRSSSTSGRSVKSRSSSSSSAGAWSAHAWPGGCAASARVSPRSSSASRVRSRWTRPLSRSCSSRARCCTSWSEDRLRRSPPLSSRARIQRIRKEFTRMSDEPKLEELDRLISRGKQKGFLTYDEVNDALPSDMVSLDQLDDIMMMFGAMDIEVVDSAKQGRLPSEVRAAQPQADDDDGDGPEPIDL